jgi:hypothetical protein
MYIGSGSITGKKVVFESILEEIPGGVSLEVVTRLDYTTASKKYLKAGAPVYVDIATRIAELCKSTKSSVAIDATHLFVPAGHHFKVSDSITDGTFCRIISAISASGTGFDVITVPSGLVITAGQKYLEATAGAASAYSTSLAYTPNGMIKRDVYIADGNADVAVVKMGTVREDALEYPIPSIYAIALRGGTAGTGTSQITLV